MGIDIAPLVWPFDGIGIGMVPCCACDWSIGIVMVEDWPCLCAGMGIAVLPLCCMGIVIGFVGPCARLITGFAAALPATGFLAVAFFKAWFFFGACFVAGAFLAGIGIVMPGMFICAAAGADMAISASVLVAAIKMLFTIPTPIESADAERPPP